MIKVKLHSSKGFKPSEQAMVDKAVSMMDRVLNSELFKKKVLAGRFTETNGKTNQEIYDIIMSGDCEYSDADGTIDLAAVMYYKRWSGVVGYVTGEDFTVYMNRKFFSTPTSIGSNLLHEATHNMGFSHYEVFETSVPYSMNRIFEACVKEMKLA